MLVFLLIGGVIVDRLPRIRIMFAADLLSGMVIAFVTVFSWLGKLELWHVYIASIIFGFVEAFFFPAYLAIVPQITPSEHLQSANSLNGLSQRVMGIIGPSIGAALVAAGGTSFTFGLNALSFFISAGCIAVILGSGMADVSQSREEPTQADPAQGSIHQLVLDLKAGFNAVASVPWIWISIVVFGFLNIMHGSPMAVALPFLIKDDLGADVKLLGILGSMSSLGFVVGMLWLGQYTRLHRRGLLGYISIAMTGVVLLLFGSKQPITILLAGMFAGGLCISVFSLIWTHTLQEMVPANLLGRVSSIDALGSFVLLPIGYALAGWATDQFGAPTVFLVGGVGTVIIALLPLLHPAIRNLD